MSTPSSSRTSLVCLLFTTLAACTAPLVSTPTLRQQAAEAAVRGQLEPQADLLSQALCQNPQAHDAVALARSLSALWASLGSSQALPCPVEMPLSAVLEGMNAAEAADWDSAQAALDAAQASAPPPWQADLAMRQAQVALHAGRVRQAYSHLGYAQKVAPQRVDVHLLLAQTLLGQGEAAASLDVLRDILRLTPTPAEIARARSLAENAIHDGEPPLSPADNAAANELAQAMESEHLDDQEVHHLLSLTHAVRHPRVLTMAGFVAMGADKVPVALDLLEEAQEQNPLDPDPPRIVAGYYAARRQWQIALPPLREAARRDPFNTKVLVMLGPTAMAAGDLDTALEAYTALTVLEPHNDQYRETLRRLEEQRRVQLSD